MAVVAMEVRLAAVMLLALAGVASAAVFKVGDSVGWTILGSPNYTAWAVSKAFHVGDTIMFEYNKNFHNVMEVSKADYAACNAASPMNTWATGNDSITVKTAGHHYYLCGIPTHCGLGQKVDIHATKAGAATFSDAPSTAPTAAPLPGSSGAIVTGIPSPAPKPNAAAAVGHHSVLASATALLLPAVVVLCY